MSIEAYPLHWPPHRPRTKAADRKRAAFHSSKTEQSSRSDGSTYNWRRTQTLTTEVAGRRLLGEISAFTPTGKTWVIDPQTVVVSSNVPVRQDGLPYSNRRDPDDPGVAVYFAMKGHQHCLTCDKWDRVADNLNAIAKHIEAMRGQLRWGVADVAAMFAGFKALPGAIITPIAMTYEEAEAFIKKHGGYRAAAMKFHPDTNSGQQRAEWDTLQRAAEVLGSNRESA